MCRKFCICKLKYFSHKINYSAALEGHYKRGGYDQTNIIKRVLCYLLRIRQVVHERKPPKFGHETEYDDTKLASCKIVKLC